MDLYCDPRSSVRVSWRHGEKELHFYNQAKHTVFPDGARDLAPYALMLGVEITTFEEALKCAMSKRVIYENIIYVDVNA